MDPLAIARGALTILRAAWKPLAALLLVLGALAWAYSRGANDRNQAWEYATAKAAARHSQELAEAQVAARQIEQGWMGAYAEMAGQLHQENLDVTAHRDRLLAAARAGGLRLPPTCPARLPDAATGTAGGDGAAGGPVPAAPGEPPLLEFLIQEAARADQIAAQLAACQEAHRAIRPR